jgi:hypothetical protein
MTKLPLLCLAAALGIGIACAPRTRSGDEAPPAKAEGKTVRSMLAVRISEDGRIEVDGARVRDAKKIPHAGGNRVWITAVSAPTTDALASLTAVADEALSRGWLVSARVRPSPASGAPEPKEERSAPPPLRLLTLGTDGRIAVPAGTVRAEDARSALAEGRCDAGTAIGLSGAASPAQLFRAAGFLAAAGCEVLVVLPSLRARAGGDTIRP